MQPRPGEKRDHDWHRGIWHGHGDLNGHDLWRELGRDTTGMVVPLSEPAFEGGAERGMLVAEFGFRNADGQVLGSAFHRYMFSQLHSLILIDAALAIRADREQDLVFGDTDDGGFAVRLSDEFRQDHGAVLLNSEGQRNTENIWGQLSSTARRTSGTQPAGMPTGTAYALRVLSGWPASRATGLATAATRYLRARL